MIKKRSTVQRRLVYSSVCDLACHPTADEVYACVIEKQTNVSKGTVYRNLNSLAEDGELLRVNIPNAPDRFDHNVHPHYHIKCKDCGAFFDLETDSLNGIESRIFECTGFLVQAYDLVFSGLCPNCQ